MVERLCVERGKGSVNQKKGGGRESMGLSESDQNLHPNNRTKPVTTTTFISNNLTSVNVFNLNTSGGTFAHE
ncbi:hypothetical protein ABZY30_35290 [Streptomyces massasporeus]|uniref:hypothetical protein n=1 Tax=Streptomyces massasporeus TaxID=67324 RepID=UPI0033A60B6D